MPDQPVVLVVDDDADVRMPLVQGLEKDGFTVVDAATGAEALRIMEYDPSISLLLADVMMPGISGVTLAERAAKLRPDLKIVLMTGYAQAAAAEPAVLLVEKPLRIADLTALIRGAFDAGR
jgi:CheY-like chemotaxis protein